MKYPFVTLDHRWIEAKDTMSLFQNYDEDGNPTDFDWAGYRDACDKGLGYAFVRVAAFRTEPLTSDRPDGMQVEFQSSLTDARLPALAGCLRAAADAMEQLEKETE